MSQDWFIFLLCSLAVFRAARLISDENGPGFIFRKLRRLPPKDSSAREGIACPFCVGMWLALFAALFLCWLEIVSWIYLVLYWFAIAGGAILWNQLFVRLSK